MVQQPRPSALEHGDGVVRVGALCLNLFELVLKHPTHLAKLCWCGSCRFAELEPPERVLSTLQPC